MKIKDLRYQEILSCSAASLLNEVVTNKVMVLRDSPDCITSYSKLMRRLGEPIHHVLEQFAIPEYREIIKISNLCVDGVEIGVRDGGSYWHTDMSYKEVNTVLTALKAVKVLSVNGETEFIDCVIGLEMIREAMKYGTFDLGGDGLDLDTMQVQHVFGNRETLRSETATTQDLNEQQQRELAANVVVHPLIITHPITQQKSVYAPAATSNCIIGFTQKESHVILDKIFDFLIAYAPRYIHYYKVGDIVIWDNLTTIHCGPAIAASNDENNCRLLYRMNVNYLKDG